MSDSNEKKCLFYRELAERGLIAYGNRIYPVSSDLKEDWLLITDKPRYINLDLWFEETHAAIEICRMEYHEKYKSYEDQHRVYESWFSKYLQEFIGKVRTTCIDINSVKDLILCDDLYPRDDNHGDEVNFLLTELLSLFPESILRYDSTESYVKEYPETDRKSHPKCPQIHE